MSKKIIIIIIIIILVAGFAIYKHFIKGEELDYTLEKVTKGTVLKSVSETGVIRSSEQIGLSFKSGGIVENMYVKVGDEVSSGHMLAKLNTADLSIQLTAAQAALEITQAKYDKLLAGASKEEIDVAETGVLNAQIELDNAEQNLKDVKNVAETGALNAQIELDNAEQNLKDVKNDADEDISQAYEDALSTLNNAYLKLYNAHNKVSLIQRTYFTFNDQEGIIISNNKDKIKNSLDQADTSLQNASNSSQNQDIDTALNNTKEALGNAKDALTVIRNTTEVVSYRDKVLGADKDSLDNHRSYINLEYTDVINAQQTISLAKVTNDKNINTAQARISAAEAKLEKAQNQNEKNINTAQARISTAEAGLEKAQNQLDLLKAGPRREDINLYQAQINQAQAEVSRLQNKIQEAILKSPNNGQITDIHKRQGEAVKQTESVVSFLPRGPFQVKVDIYEEDIINIEIGNPVIINLVAFPTQPLNGEVVSVDPAERLIDGVVYYETTINFNELVSGIKPGMTADIIIETDKKEDIIIISKYALKHVKGITVVKVFNAGVITEQDIDIGLEGDSMVEVVSGLKLGDEIVID